MSDVSPALRERLAEELPLGVEVLTERTSDRGATRKALLRLGGQHVVEAVLMGYPDRVTVCISSQAGCAMGCTFCATGQMGLQNNLTAGEIAAQAVWARREAARLPESTPQRLTNVVFMGMGEPFANQRHVFASLARLTDPAAFGLGARHITVSTVGIVPGIERLAERAPQVGLAVSFHAASDELRDQLVPPNTRYPLLRLERAIARLAAAHPPSSLDRVGADRPRERHDRTGGAPRADRTPARRARQPDPAQPDAGLPGARFTSRAHPSIRRDARADSA